MLKFDVVQNIIDAYGERTAFFLSLAVITNGKLALLYEVFNGVEVPSHLFWFALVACVALWGGRMRCSAGNFEKVSLPQFSHYRNQAIMFVYVLSVSAVFYKAGYFPAF